jgi:hypothetical protein
MLSGESFIKMVRSNNPDMDARLADIYNQNLLNISERSFRRAWYIIGRQKEFARNNMSKFLDEFNNIKEQIARNGVTGDALEKQSLAEYMRNDKK